MRREEAERNKRIERNHYDGPKLSKYENYLLILMVASLCVAFLSLAFSYFSLNISKSNSIEIANFTMQQQISFDKQTAAMQLLNEIDHLNWSLQPYSIQYLKGFDFSENGKGIMLDPKSNYFLRINDENATRLWEIMMLGNGNFEGLRVIRKPTRDNKTLRDMYSNIDDQNVRFLKNRLNYSGDVENITLIMDSPIIPEILYDDRGMYYAYQRDISKFNNKTLSQKLYAFYNSITWAEYNRQYLESYRDSSPNNKLNEQYFDAYMDMRLSIMNAVKMIPDIKRELIEEENS